MDIRIHFHKTDAMRFTSHLDLHHSWERTLRRANLPLSYSQGFNPRPKINLASALPLGFTSQAEIIDIHLDAKLHLGEIQTAIEQAIPPGLRVESISVIPPHSPALQSLLHAAEYQITFLDPVPGLESRLTEIIAAPELPRQRRGKAYDLRPLILDIKLLPASPLGQAQLLVRLLSKEGATGRPEEVILELGEIPENCRIHRTGLIFSSADGA